MRLTARRGDAGSHVVELQRLLSGYGLVADGIFGPLTEAAVRAFQAWAELDVDGVVGPATWAALLGEPHRPHASASPPTVFSIVHPERVQLAPLPEGLTWGLDVSSAGQPRPLPWQCLYGAGARFAWVRVLHGVDPDSWAVQHAADAKAAGLLVGAYGVLTTFDPGLAWQCGENLTRRAIELGATDLPLALDLELPIVARLAAYPAADILSLLDAARAFCERAEEIAGRRCVVYAGPAWLTTAAQRTGSAGWKKLAALADRRPLWLAHYGLDLAGWPATPEPWTETAIWQASGDDGRLRVDGHPVDLDLYRGTADDLRGLGR